MNPKVGYRLLLLVFSLTVVCLLTAATHELMNGLLPVWLGCCHYLQMFLTSIGAGWVALTARTMIAALLLIGVATMGRRLWHIHRFLLTLNTASSSEMTAILPRRLAGLCNQLGLSPHVVLLPTSAPLAFCFGFFTPRICVSIGLVKMLMDPELKAVLLHEDHHRQQYDPLRTLLADVFASMLFFLPVAAEWRAYFLTATELAADRHAARLAGRGSLAGALHKLLSHAPAVPLPVGIGGVRGINITAARIAQLVDERPTPLSFSRPRLLHSALMLMVVCFVLQAALS
jgi:Zn-dependent protease with chaperone function